MSSGPGVLRKMALLIGLTMLLPPVVFAELTVQRGPTPILRGDAQGDNDITINNGLFAVAFAVETAPPWGVARGGILDIALIRDGVVGYDIASLADFMPNSWSSWPTTYQRVTIDRQSPDEVVIRTERDWGEVELVTFYRLRDNDPRINIVTTMVNHGKQPLTNLLTGYVVWPDGGHLFGVPGLSGVTSSSEAQAFGDWSAAYDEQWVLGLHAPFSEFVSYGGRDRYLPHTLAAGESKVFEAVLQIENRGDLALLVKEEIRAAGLDSGKIAGLVTDADGRRVAAPAVIVSRHGKVIAWTIGDNGHYDLQLPVGKYEIYATASGYSRSAAVNFWVEHDADSRLNFSGLQPPGSINVDVITKQTHEPLDARISIETGNEATIKFFGKNTFFTELDTPGHAKMTMAPGDYQLRISAGAGFSSMPVYYDVTVKTGQSIDLQAEIEVTARPQDHGWFSADLHHHSDVLDGFSEPLDVLRSELASGVDITFLSDHDSVINNAELNRLSRSRGFEFIPGTELSPSWAHFNAYPLDDGAIIEIDIGASTVQQIFAEARRMGADVVHVNHPYSEYGYFRSLELEVEHDGKIDSAVPGGLDESFDVIEITSGDNSLTLQRTWQLWNNGKRAYLVGGSDVHDVWNEESGTSRTYVYIDGDLNVDSFVAELQRGRAFASQGPLVFPEIIFGEELSHPRATDLTLTYKLQAAAGLHSVRVIERGVEVKRREFDHETTVKQVTFTVQPATDTWYSVIVEDADGRQAFSNPIWVQVEK
ncbi:MAG: CehA/McbA family metallohydrolase [Proteobacteria bacterium]|nr:CehA/McbA family metallohydrolase [Pseudomonadota bacterium]